MTSGRKNGDLGHIYSGDELRWHFTCDAQGCSGSFDGKGVRKAAVIRAARQHLRENPDHGSGVLSAIVYQPIRAIQP